MCKYAHQMECVYLLVLPNNQSIYRQSACYWRGCGRSWHRLVMKGGSKGQQSCCKGLIGVHVIHVVYWYLLSACIECAYYMYTYIYMEYVYMYVYMYPYDIHVSAEDRFTVQWDKVHNHDHVSSGTFTFQLTLFKNGRIHFAYQEVNIDTCTYTCILYMVHVHVHVHACT